MYGAVGDGVTDDTNAIQTAINNNPHKTIVLSKEYRVDRQICISYSSSKHVSIDFSASKIKYNGDGAFLYIGSNATEADINEGVSANMITISNGYIEGNGNNTFIFIETHLMNVRIYNVETSNFKHGIQVGKDLTSQSTTNPNDLLIDGCLLRGTSSNVEGNGITLNGGDNKIVNTRIYGFRKAININSSGNIFSNIHTLFTGQISSDLIRDECCAVYDNSVGFNNYTDFYCDTYPTAIIMKKGSDTTIKGFNFISYLNNMDVKLFDLSNANWGSFSFSLNQATIYLPSEATSHTGIIIPTGSIAGAINKINLNDIKLAIPNGNDKLSRNDLLRYGTKKITPYWNSRNPITNQNYLKLCDIFYVDNSEIQVLHVLSGDVSFDLTFDINDKSSVSTKKIISNAYKSDSDVTYTVAIERIDTLDTSKGNSVGIYIKRDVGNMYTGYMTIWVDNAFGSYIAGPNNLYNLTDPAPTSTLSGAYTEVTF